MGSGSYTGIKFNQRPSLMGWRERILPFKRKYMNTYLWNRDERERRGQRNTQTYCWRNSADYGKEEPNEALTDKNDVSNLEHHNENRNHPTWFRRTRSKPIAPDPACRRNKPMSMMRSNAMSANSEPIRLDFMAPGLNMMHMLFSFDHETRT